MTLTIIQQLWAYGHFFNPLNSDDSWNLTEADLPKLTLKDKVVREAIASWQSFDTNMERLVYKHHMRGLVADGDVGPASMDLFSLPRCSCPDFQDPREPKSRIDFLEQGSWPSCDPEHPDEHSVRIRVKQNRMPDYTKLYFDQIQANLVRMAAEMGYRLRYTDDDQVEIDVDYGWLAGNTIGYQYLPTPNTCNQTVTGVLSMNFYPGVHDETLLHAHEHMLHGSGFGHTRGGIGNPSIISGLPLSFIGDPAEPLFRRAFGPALEPQEPDNPTEPVDPGSPDVKAAVNISVDGQLFEFICIPKPGA